jgi:hypothetical protein
MKVMKPQLKYRNYKIAIILTTLIITIVCGLVGVFYCPKAGIPKWPLGIATGIMFIWFLVAFIFGVDDELSYLIIHDNRIEKVTWFGKRSIEWSNIKHHTIPKRKSRILHFNYDKQWVTLRHLDHPNTPEIRFNLAILSYSDHRDLLQILEKKTYCAIEM